MYVMCVRHDTLQEFVYNWKRKEKTFAYRRWRLRWKLAKSCKLNVSYFFWFFMTFLSVAFIWTAWIRTLTVICCRKVLIATHNLQHVVATQCGTERHRTASWVANRARLASGWRGVVWHGVPRDVLTVESLGRECTLAFRNIYRHGAIRKCGSRNASTLQLHLVGVVGHKEKKFKSLLL